MALLKGALAKRPQRIGAVFSRTTSGGKARA